MFEQVEQILAPWIKDRQEPEADRLDVIIDAENLVPAVQALTDARWGYLSAITGLDLGAEKQVLEVLYHFCEGANILTLRVPLARENACVASLCSVIPAARLYERELREMFGVTITDLQDTGYLFLPDDWPEGVHPLRKDAVIS